MCFIIYEHLTFMICLKILNTYFQHYIQVIISAYKKKTCFNLRKLLLSFNIVQCTIPIILYMHYSNIISFVYFRWQVSSLVCTCYIVHPQILIVRVKLNDTNILRKRYLKMVFAIKMNYTRNKIPVVEKRVHPQESCCRSSINIV